MPTPRPMARDFALLPLLLVLLFSAADVEADVVLVTAVLPTTEVEPVPVPAADAEAVSVAVVDDAVDVTPGALLIAVKMSMDTTRVPLQQL